MRTIFDRMNSFFVVVARCSVGVGGDFQVKLYTDTQVQFIEKPARESHRLRVKVICWCLKSLFHFMWYPRYSSRIGNTIAWAWAWTHSGYRYVLRECREMGRDAGQCQGNYNFSELFPGFPTSGEHRPLTSALWSFKRCSCTLLQWISFVFLSDFWPTARIWSHLSMMSWAI